MSTLPTYYLSHGGGPWPWMKDQLGGRFDRLEASLVSVRRELGERPKAVLAISGHWETPAFAVSSGARPGMIYDYYGFPEHTYHITYGAPGSPELAAEVRRRLEDGGFDCVADPDRGFDHGTFSLLQPMWPQADVPVVQLSMQQDLDPATHLAVGRLLKPLRDEGVLILGSGSSFHNLAERSAAAVEPARRFDAWLQEALVEAPPAERSERLIRWADAPAARIAHPREDHLIPLMVTVGAAEAEAGTCIYHEDGVLGGWTLSSFRFGDPPAA